MASRYISAAVQLPSQEEGVSAARADLEFSGVDHSGVSFEARVFLDNPEADEATPREVDAGYAGSFHIFGHGGCYGDVGHCDVRARPLHVFDRRQPHQLLPHRKVVTVPEELLRRVTGGEDRSVVVTVVPVSVTPPPGALAAESDDLLRFEELTLVTYESYGPTLTRNG